MSTCITVQTYGLVRVFCCFTSLRQQCYSLQGEDSEDWRGVKDMAWCAWSTPSSQSEHPAPADNHQFTVTPASNYCNIELLCNHVNVIIHNLLSKRKEYISGGRDIPELSLNWTPALTVCFSHGQQCRAGSGGHSTTPAGEQGSQGQPQPPTLGTAGTSAHGWGSGSGPGRATRVRHSPRMAGWGPGDGPRLG